MYRVKGTILFSLIIAMASANANDDMHTTTTNKAFDNAGKIIAKYECRKLYRKYLAKIESTSNLFNAFSYTASENGLYETCAYSTKKNEEEAKISAIKACNDSRSKKRYVKKFAPPCILLANGVEVTASLIDYNLTPAAQEGLYTAAIQKSTASFRELIALGGQVNAGPENNYQAPLIAAARESRLDIIKLLIENGADIDAQSSAGFTAINFAARDGDLSIVEYLIKQGSDLKIATRNGSSPVYHAAENGHFDILVELIMNGADIEQAKTGNQTPLHGAASKGRLETAKALIKFGADINHLSKSNRTPLDTAIYRNRTDMVEYLISVGAKTAKEINNNPT